MSLNGVTKYSLDKQQYLGAIRNILKLLMVSDDDENELKGLAPSKQEKLDTFLAPTIPAGCFYEDSFFDHVQIFIFMADLSEHFQEIVDSGKLFSTDLTQTEVKPPSWVSTEEGESRRSIMFAALYTLQKSINAIKATSWPINHFISEGRKGNRSALKTAVKLDTIAITSPTVAAEIMKSELTDKGKFRRDLNNALRYPHKIERVQHGLLRFVLRTMHDDGMLSQLDDQERYQFFCVELGLYPNKNDESFDSLNRFIRGCVSSFRT